MLRVYCDVRKCTSCGSCETACAARQYQGEAVPGTVPQHLPAADWDQAVMGRLKPFALRCRFCTETPCTGVCPTGAIQKSPITGSVAVDRDKCIGCWECTKVCASRAVVPDAVSGKALKCDLCEGLEVPACAAACPSRALEYEQPDEFEEAVGVKVIRG